MRRYAVLILTGLFCLTLLTFSCPSFAAPYFEGKVITIIVGYNAGGGYDRVARLLAKYLPEYIPGKPTVLVQNMPGADSMVCANHVYSVAKPDGLTIGTFNRGLPFAQLLKAQGVKFDMRKFSWVGSAAEESTILILHSDLPYKTIQDVAKAKEPIIIGTGGPSDSTGQFPTLMKELLGYNFKFVTYSGGSADIMLAIERKEVDGRGVTYSTARDFINRGVVRPFARCSVSEPGIENLPVDEDLTNDPKVKTVMAIRSAPDKIARPYVAPPGTPAEVMQILTNAFDKASKDPALLEDAKKAQMGVIQYKSAKDVEKILDYVLTQPPDVVTEISKYIKF